MPQVYRITGDSQSQQMPAVVCKNEDVELQRLLENNPDLLAGEQISPEDPRRWLLIKREMEVPDPTSGSSRWSIDLLFVDQDGILTFVECKRYEDTRARREVIAQVLEYAANARRYWTAEQLRTYATAAATKVGSTMDMSIARLGVTAFPAAELFDRAVQNLATNDIRIVLFLEQAPAELKSLVEFLNKELATIELLLVEGRMYETEGVRVIAPTLWGYTEEIRQRKEAIAAIASGSPKRWTQESYFTDLKARSPGPENVIAVEQLFTELPKRGWEYSWGTGKSYGTLNFKVPSLSNNVMLSVSTLGDIFLAFSSFLGTPAMRAFADRVADAFTRLAGFTRPPNYPKCNPRIPPSDWTKHVKLLIDELHVVAKEK